MGFERQLRSKCFWWVPLTDCLVTRSNSRALSSISCEACGWVFEVVGKGKRENWGQKDNVCSAQVGIQQYENFLLPSFYPLTIFQYQSLYNFTSQSPVNPKSSCSTSIQPVASSTESQSLSGSVSVQVCKWVAHSFPSFIATESTQVLRCNYHDASSVLLDQGNHALSAPA